MGEKKTASILKDNPSAEEILQHLSKDGSIDIASVCDQITMEKNKKYLDMHPYDIWLGKDGRYHTYLPAEDGKGRLHRHRRTKRELEDYIIAYWKQESENPTINEVFSEWCDHRRSTGRVDKSTCDRDQRFYDRHYGEFGKRRIRSVKPIEIVEFLEQQITLYNLSAKAFSGLKSITRGFLRRAKRFGYISYDIEPIFDDIDWADCGFEQKSKDDDDEILTTEEDALLVPYLLEHLDKLNMALLLTRVSGVRVGELATIRNIDIHDDRISIRQTETKYKGPDGKDVYAVKDHPKRKSSNRDVVIPKDYLWLLKEIRKLNPDGEYPFVNENGRMTTNCFRQRLYRIEDKIGFRRRKGPHKIRKTVETILLDQGLDDKMVLSQMGQKEKRVAENNYHYDRRSVQNKQNILSSIEEFQMPAKKSDVS